MKKKWMALLMSGLVLTGSLAGAGSVSAEEK